MTGTQVFFWLFALVVLGSAIKVVTERNLLYAALWLVSTLLGVAGLYMLLNAGFLAMVQVVVYVGAIAVLFVFAVMLVRRDRDMGSQLNANWGAAALIAAAVFGLLVALQRNFHGIVATPKAMPADFDAVTALGTALVKPDAYLLPFEVASVLLLAALVGAVYLAAKK
jgi:NADH-quinone oxidoreductase subunit J